MPSLFLYSSHETTNNHFELYYAFKKLDQTLEADDVFMTEIPITEEEWNRLFDLTRKTFVSACDMWFLTDDVYISNLSHKEQEEYYGLINRIFLSYILIT